MKVNVVFHIDSNEKQRMKVLIGNLKNLLNEVDNESSFICVVANASAANLFVEQNSIEHKNDIKDLHDKGVNFYVCNNSINNFNIDKEDLFSECEIVKAGVLKLIELQSKYSCSYIKP